MFYSLVRSYMHFRKIQSRVQTKRHMRQRSMDYVHPRDILEEVPEVITVTIDHVADGIGLSIIQAKVCVQTNAIFFSSLNHAQISRHVQKMR